ncbi:hypothetical protein Cgig2_008744 [Carnegiea gigantea]|uniref:Uncharacterized protein n=1 Tax=Carnegiea gigantea TaxID=171969 RepID=A0A9Q1JUL9_9CARY|nr:hypothetical protein Cgig2_008744 [Carnegiea gigantea]
MLRLEQRKRWQEYRSSHPCTNDSSQSPLLSDRDIWVQGNLTSKGRMYGFDAEGVSHLSVSSRSSFVNNYDACETAMRLNESAVKATEEARQKKLQDFRKQVEEEVRAKVIMEVNNQWAEKEAKIHNDLAQEKAVRQQDNKKAKSKMSKLWRSSIASPEATPSEDDDEDEPDTTDLGNSSRD